MTAENPLAALPESAMWSNTPELEAALDALIDGDTVGLFVATPARVAVATTGTLPLVGCRAETLREACLQRSFAESAVVIASSLDRGHVRADLAFELPGDVLADPARLSGDPGPGITGGTFRVDLVQRLALPSGPDRYVGWVLVRDRISNATRFETRDPPPAYDDPEVTRFIAAWRSSHPTPPAPPSPPRVEGQRWPSYGVFPGAPDPPRELGFVLSVPRVFVLKRGAPCEFTASFRVPVRPQEKVLDPGAFDGATAIVPLTLVITGGDWAGPVVARLRVPCFTPIEPADLAPVVEGQLALDLLALPGMWNVPRTCFVWAFNGDLVSGPATVAFVSDAMLRGERPVDR